MNTAELKQLIASYTDDVWNKGDVGAIERYYHAAYVHHDVSRPDVKTLADYTQWARDLHGALRDMRIQIDDLIADGGDGKAVKRWTATGVNVGSLAGLPPTGKPVSFSGTSAYRIVGGRIAESWYVYDLFGLLQQLK
jgi:steroid delta-isomerase-like uncharacterized protein